MWRTWKRTGAAGSGWSRCVISAEWRFLPLKFIAVGPISSIFVHGWSSFNTAFHCSMLVAEGGGAYISGFARAGQDQ